MNDVGNFVVWQVGNLPMKMEQTQCSETSAIKHHTAENNPKVTHDIQNTAKAWNQESPFLIYFGRERGWWITCNYPTVLKKKNRNRKSTTCAICWLKSVLHEEKRREKENHNIGLRPTLCLMNIMIFCSRRFSSCSTDFSQQITQDVLFLFLFFSFKTVG
jgi:hypothetical protein